ncbi:WD repeat-containing protein 88-like [Gigantopelta aegis]|uniref:WD repeat-containing protein 88-like n=1 Tax=Gigantopelta aegis TaxID=1735272 RepID=UPI001B88E4B1|nr:WD repeat-containing protein 88-like [Gigantopelta aegis]
MSDDAIDPLALELNRDLNLAAAGEAQSRYTLGLWENEELAKVRIKVFNKHTASVNSCDVFCNDRFVLTASDDHSVKLWDSRSGSLRRSYDELHSMEISEGRPSHDGTRFVTCGWDKMVKFWDTENGTCLWKLGHGGVVMCCKLSHNGNLVCSGSDFDNSVKITDTRTGDIVHNLKAFYKSTVTSCVFSFDDCKVISTSMDRTTKFFDLRSATNTISLGGHINVISGCAITQNERNFATCSWDKSVQLWDISTGMYRANGPISLKGSHEGSISCCNFSSDGLMLVTGSFDNCIVVWDSDNHVTKLKLQGHTNWVNDVKFTDDQKWLISCSKDKTVRMWNIEDSDKIPAVLENRKSIGLKVISCTRCKKPFSMSQVDNFRELALCVFCRLQNPEKSWLSLEESDT